MAIPGAALKHESCIGVGRLTQGGDLSPILDRIPGEARRAISAVDELAALVRDLLAVLVRVGGGEDDEDQVARASRLA